MNFILIECFLILLLFSGSDSQDCGINPPTKISDCFNRIKFNATDSYCCYLETDDLQLCKQVSMRNYTTETEYYYYNSTKYKILCDINNEYADLQGTGTECGRGDQPVYTSDCTNYSLSNNRCCFYNNTITNNYKCFWLGSFSTTIFQFGDDNGVIISCSSDCIFSSLIKILLPTLILFI